MNNTPLVQQPHGVCFGILVFEIEKDHILVGRVLSQVRASWELINDLKSLLTSSMPRHTSWSSIQNEQNVVITEHPSH